MNSLNENSALFIDKYCDQIVKILQKPISSEIKVEVLMQMFTTFQTETKNQSKRQKTINHLDELDTLFVNERNEEWSTLINNIRQVIVDGGETFVNEIRIFKILTEQVKNPNFEKCLEKLRTLYSYKGLYESDSKGIVTMVDPEDKIDEILNNS